MAQYIFIEGNSLVHPINTALGISIKLHTKEERLTIQICKSKPASMQAKPNAPSDSRHTFTHNTKEGRLTL